MSLQTAAAELERSRAAHRLVLDQLRWRRGDIDVIRGGRPSSAPRRKRRPKLHAV